MDVKHLCLGVLTMGDATGYDIKKHFEESFRHFFSAGYGSIYPALAELNKKGWVTCHEQAQEKLPDKKIYSVTDSGKKAFVDALSRTAPRHKVRSPFMAMMYFAHLLPPERLRDALEERLVEIEMIMDSLTKFEGQTFDERPGIAFTIGYGNHMLSAMSEYIRNSGAELMNRVSTSVDVDVGADDQDLGVNKAKLKAVRSN